MEPENSNVLIVTVHGIRTYADWQERFANIMEDRPGIEGIISFRYKFFSTLSYLIPPLRVIAVWRFRRFLRDLAKKRDGRQIHIIAHSFGAYLVTRALLRLKQHERPKVGTLLLCGSVLKQLFPWEKLVGSNGCVRRVVNDCGEKDIWPIVAQLIAFGMGSSGRRGFAGPVGKSVGVVNRYYNDIAHSDFFRDRFMAEHWMPILVDAEEPLGDHSVPQPAGKWAEIEYYADPVKLAVLLIPIAAVWYLVVEVQERQRLIAETNLRVKAPHDMTKSERDIVRAACAAVLGEEERPLMAFGPKLTPARDNVTYMSPGELDSLCSTKILEPDGNGQIIGKMTEEKHMQYTNKDIAWGFADGGVSTAEQN